MDSYAAIAQDIRNHQREGLEEVSKAGYRPAVARAKANDIRTLCTRALQENAAEARAVAKAAREAVRPPVVTAEQSALARERVKTHGFTEAVTRASELGDAPMSLALAAEAQWLNVPPSRRRQNDLSNKYCRSTDLSNEASVELFFVQRLLVDLGYKDSEIRTKHAVDELPISRGRQREPHRPDFLISGRSTSRPGWLIEAKEPGADIEKYTYQAAGYALAVNRRYKDNPLRFYMLTNGLLTRVYQWDAPAAVLSLRFADFAKDNPKFEALTQLLGAPAARRGWDAEPIAGSTVLLERPNIDEVKKAFLRCHKIIWKAEKMSPQAAFVEFAKLLFVKLWEDRRLRDDPDTLALIGQGEAIPAELVRFSTSWVLAQEVNDPNPVGNILFRQLVSSLEDEIDKRQRKRIFRADEQLDLAPGTIKRVVRELERWYLFGIDEDLNGRMFEAFLTATMRGQALGQYFTPRSVVKLMTRLAEPVATRDHVDRVLDACCGTGGFLTSIHRLTSADRRRASAESAS